MKVLVVGTGHVGLVTAASLAAVGHDVVGYDIDGDKIRALEDGRVPFFEPGLLELIRNGRAAARLSFSTDLSDAVRGAEVSLIAVGTPPRVTGEANLVAVERSARAVALAADEPLVIAEKSTVPAGTARRLKKVLVRERPALAEKIDVVSNPEFLREGKAVEDSLKPTRILVGADSERGFDVMRRLYQPFTEAGAILVETDLATAEIAKHASNAFLALKISYANALARICERTGGDVVSVAHVMGLDPRIGSDFLAAGLGFGGSCFPKDIRAFERLAREVGYDFPLLGEILRINHETVAAAADAINELLWNLEGKRVALLGLAFKPGTDDVRFSPALALARELISRGATVVGYDPVAMDNAREDLPELTIAADPYDAASGSDCLVMCTEWPEFRSLDLKRIKDAMAIPLIFDGRNQWQQELMLELGFTYVPVGRPALGEPAGEPAVPHSFNGSFA